MHDDALIEAHKEWLGYVQPVGLLVAPAALVHRGIVPDRNVASLQEHLDATTRASVDAEPIVSDFAEFATSLLGWEHRDLAGAPGGPLLPEELAADLIEYGERLTPTYAIPAAGNDANAWQMLIRVETPGVDFDQAMADDGKHWAASPHARFERLLRETNIPVGLLANGKSFRLIYAPKGETSGFATFDIESMLEVAGRPMLSAFHMLLRVERLFGSAEQSLPALLAESREYQETVSKELADQVLVALNELLRGFHAADLRTHRTGTVDLIRSDPDHLYSGLLTALLRLVFVLYAEDRDLFPHDAVWEQNYSLGGLFERLRDDAALYPDTMDDRYGAWAQLLALWRLMYFGGRHADLRLVARRGQLFDPSRFLFMEGRTSAEDSGHIPAISDGVIWRVLSALMLLGGERLSYRTLDVEQLGSVYQSVMGFTVDVTTGPAIAIRPPKRSGAAATIDLTSLLAQTPARRPEWIRERTDRKLTPKLSSAVRAAKSTSELEVALSAIVDTRLTAKALPAGVPVLQPTETRRRTGSHYTPRRLTAPIVAETLRPIVERLGEDATAEDIVALRILDPALGSGAFLVEACRQLAEHLTAAWERHGTLPRLPPDEDALLHARRLIAQRCLYGVDKNLMAVDLAKLSLWLATLAKEHEFTFVDHAVRHGDSMISLSRSSIEQLNWNDTGTRSFASVLISDRLRDAMTIRNRILSSGDAASEVALRELLNESTSLLSDVSMIGDAIIATFFNGDNMRARRKELQRLVDSIGFGEDGWQSRIRNWAEAATPLNPFHWEIEFPEVFLRDNGGFDAIIGNPPFMGGLRISEILGMPYFEWLLEIHSGAKHVCDLSAHFFRSCFTLLRTGGCFGLVATNSIAQGDSRESGLGWIVSRGGQIYAANKRLRWPGDAAVVVSVVHVLKNGERVEAILNGQRAASISCYLVAGDNNETPARLAEAIYSTRGVNICGQGFIFDDTDSRANPLALMDTIIAERPDLISRITPYIGGAEINAMSSLQIQRYIINLSDLQTEEDLQKVGPLALIVREKVKPERDRLGSNPNNIPLKRKWWAYQAHRPAFFERIKDKKRVMCHATVSKHLAFTFLPTGLMYSGQLIVFDTEDFADFAVAQSNVHDIWVRFFGSTLEDRLRYTASDVFQTFPFPRRGASIGQLDDIGRRYFDFRSEVMNRADQGLTEIYNRFNDPNESSPEISTLRRLHEEMDRAVFEAYGWDDFACQPVFEPEWTDDSEIAPVHYRWPEEIRDVILGRLISENAKRAQEESDRGISTRSRGHVGSASSDDLDSESVGL